jgi:hypothetical protein
MLARSRTTGWNSYDQENFKKQHAANDGPWKRQQHQDDRGRQNSHHDRPPRHNNRPRVSAVLPHYDDSFEEPPQSYSTVVTNSVANIQTPPSQSSPKLSSLRFAPGTTTTTHNANGTQSVQQEAIDYVQEEPLQGYRSPLVNHFISPPSVTLIIDHHSTLLMPLPDDDPAIDDDVLDALEYNEHLVSRVAIALPPRGQLKHADYVWFHLDTGATCTVSHCSGESHCPTPTTVKCETAADSPSHIVESLGYFIGDFETSNSKMIPFEIPDHATIPSFKRRSMSLHALKDIGFDVTHSLLSTGNFLTIRRADSTERFQSVPLITHGRSDYV